MKKVAFLMMGLFCVVSQSAWAFSDDRARRAILDLRQEVRQLQEQVDLQQRAKLQLVSQIADLLEQNRYLTGRVEELTNQSGIQGQSTQDLYLKLDDRLKALEPVSVMLNGSTVTVYPLEKATFDQGVQALRDGKYRLASKVFESFNTVWVTSPYREDALFWWGNAAFSDGAYKSSYDILNQLMKEFPSSKHIPDAMLTIGSAQASLKNFKAAQATFKKVISKYAEHSAADIAKERLAALQKKSK